MNYYIYEHNNDPRRHELKLAIKTQLQTLVTDPTQADLILVLGGDGTIIDAIHRLHHLHNPFFGVNCGTVGFLLNDIASPQEIPEHTNNIEYISEPFLEATIYTHDEHVYKAKAVNDLFISEDVRNYPTFFITKGEKQLGPITGSGLLISSALGSSGYRANGMGPMIPVGNDNIGIMGIFSRPYSYSITSGDEQIDISITNRGPIDIHIDGKYKTFHDIHRVLIKNSTEQFSLGFLKQQNALFENKRLQLFTKKFQQTF